VLLLKSAAKEGRSGFSGKVAAEKYWRVYRNAITDDRKGFMKCGHAWPRLPGFHAENECLVEAALMDERKKCRARSAAL
jgi:hypothetical protein